MPLERPSYATIRNRYLATVETRLPGADARLPYSDLDVTGHVLAEAASSLYEFGLRIADQILPNTADADQLEVIAADWSIHRKPAEAAQGSVTVTLIGDPGAVVPAGTRIQIGGRDYATDVAATVTTATAAVAVTALEAGAAGNVEAGASGSLVSPVAGISAKVLAGDIVGGTDPETDGELLARLLLRMRRPPHGGNADDFEGWALDCAGVTRAWVHRGTPRRGIVTVLIVKDGNAGGPIPTAAEVAEVQAYIDRPDIGPVCGECVVRAPDPVVHDLVVQLDPNTPEVRSAALEAIQAFWRSEAAPGATISLSRLSAAISAAAGEVRHRIVAPAADIAHATFEMAVLGAVTFEAYA